MSTYIILCIGIVLYLYIKRFGIIINNPDCKYELNTKYYNETRF